MNIRPPLNNMDSLFSYIRLDIAHAKCYVGIANLVIASDHRRQGLLYISFLILLVFQHNNNNNNVYF